MEILSKPAGHARAVSRSAARRVQVTAPPSVVAESITRACLKAQFTQVGLSLERSYTQFILHLAEGMAERGTLEPEALQDLKTIDRFFGEMDVRGRAARWPDALTANVTWSEVRTLARRILVARPGEWRLPLPRRVPPQHLYD
ncbi:hypothetical protein ACFTY8_34915 [Streptomyces mirabilis]|uniref:hypothetical protein n=1 Tax=Streptomyces mirabilis TaxID=68239 RepID=UPI00362BABDA